MLNPTLTVAAVILWCLLVACDHSNNHATLPDTPVNLGDVNSPFDDYNSDSPLFGDTFPLCFSSNRNSGGNNFDIVYKLIDVIASRENNDITVVENKNQQEGTYIQNSNITDALNRINSSSDELGPYLISKGLRLEGTTNNVGSYESYIFLFSSDSGGDQDIRYLHNLSAESYTTPKAIDYLNSPQDDTYPSLMNDSSALYFCSNRSGQFDIYKTLMDETVTVLQNFENHSPREIVKDTNLSSSFDEKCPYIVNNVMVFTSNRPGGYGGYDLYYSIYRDGAWTTAVNFGDKINTEHDEYRPIVRPMTVSFTNDLMIFSSNRPGGLGGFDLYYVGVTFPGL